MAIAATTKIANRYGLDLVSITSQTALPLPTM